MKHLINLSHLVLPMALWLTLFHLCFMGESIEIHWLCGFPLLLSS